MLLKKNTSTSDNVYEVKLNTLSYVTIQPSVSKLLATDIFSVGITLKVYYTGTLFSVFQLDFDGVCVLYYAGHVFNCISDKKKEGIQVPSYYDRASSTISDNYIMASIDGNRLNENTIKLKFVNSDPRSGLCHDMVFDIDSEAINDIMCAIERIYDSRDIAGSAVDYLCSAIDSYFDEEHIKLWGL